MSANWHIRPAEERDIPAIAALIPLAVRALSQGFYSDAEIERAVAHVFGVDRQLIEDGTYFVVESNNQVIGAGGWSKRKTMFGGDQTSFKEAGDPQLDPRVDAARIRAFYVHPDFARRGIGRAILKHCEQEAATTGFTKLELIATLPGVPLYEACGYEAIHPYNIVMPDGGKLPALRMGKSI